jgi:hypothetical protein
MFWMDSMTGRPMENRSFMASSNSSDKDISRLLQRLKDFTCIFTVGQTTYTDALVLPFWNEENDLGLISNDPGELPGTIFYRQNKA